VAAVFLLVLSIALFDSLNPSTIAPAFVLATGGRPVRAVASFAAGVFAVSTAGGLVLLFVGAHSVLPWLAHPSSHARHAAAFIGGIALLALAVVFWVWRARIWRRQAASAHGHRSAPLLGAGIMAIELPTALPYFGAILAIAAARRGAAAEALLLLLYNAVFVAPLLAVAALASIGSRHGSALVERPRALLFRHGPHVVPAGMALIGVALAVIGARRL
jgi:cytochrome c biogenesis protein CcdA